MMFIATSGLEVAEEFQGFLELARETAAIKAQQTEGMIGIDDVEGDSGFFGGRVGGAGEEIGFEFRNAIEAPGGVDQFLDELAFGGSLGLVFVNESLRVFLVGGGVLVGQEDGLTGQSMAQGVQLGALFAGFGARPGGVERIGAVYRSAVVTRRYG